MHALRQCAVLLLLALMLTHRTAAACSVGGFPKMLPGEAEIAFTATIENVRIPWVLRHCDKWPTSLGWVVRWLPHDVVLTLRVESVWRGLEGDHVSLSFHDRCGATGSGLVGKTLLFLEHSDTDTRAGRFEAGPCDYPGLLNDYGAIAASLGTAHAPRPRSASYTGLYVAGSLLGVGFTAVGVWSRRRASRLRAS